MANLPADLPEDWTSNQKITPNGTEVGLTPQHGYNYLMEQVNATQTEVNAINTSLEDVAQETSVQQVITTIGTTTDSGGSSTEGSLMAKLNEILEQLGISTTGNTVQEVLEELLTQPNIIKHSQISTVYTNDIDTIELTGFSNIEKMICIPAGLYIQTFTQTSVTVLSVGDQNYTYKTVQVIEFY